jgi:hypothetical protein
VVEGIKEPMHAGFGVPGPCGYPVIRYFVQVIISAGVGRHPIGILVM